ncbi:NAD(P)/FAD-dependent oxidoreductase [Bacillus salipaludis]|uniref:flavin-containing monooxygenase n=1 Tax=Bacillus salipaludis TaxID=2547811 RepID=UPI003D236D47
MEYDVVIIGAGQAGLSMGYFLKQSGISFLILDNQSRAGDVWRNRYDSLVLFTPRLYSSLPGLPLGGDPSGFPTKDEIADYLEQYAQTFDLPIRFNIDIQKIRKENNIFAISTNKLTIKTKRIVIATGPFHTPRIPPFAKVFSNELTQLHSSEYKDQSQLQEGPVLVVGGGNSGAQIAVELSENNETYLSVSQKIRFMPLKFAGKSIFWWFDKLGILRADRHSFIGKKIQSQGDPVFGYELKEKIKNRSVIVKSRTKSIHKNEIQFEDHTSIMVNNIIWATGFTPNYRWIEIPNLLNPNGEVNHKRGVTEIDGLFFLGLPWQHRRGSALLLGVGEDAEYLYKYIRNDVR